MILILPDDPFLQTLIGGILAILGGIAGSIISGYYLIKSHEKAEIQKERVKMFEKLFEEIYAPFQEIAEEVIIQNEISAENSRKLMELVYENKKLIIMCPDDIKKGLSNLEKDLREDDYVEAIKRTKTMKKEISKLIDKFLLK